MKLIGDEAMLVARIHAPPSKQRVTSVPSQTQTPICRGHVEP